MVKVVFNKLSFFWWQAIYEVCSGEENVVADLKMIKEVSFVHIKIQLSLLKLRKKMFNLHNHNTFTWNAFAMQKKQNVFTLIRRRQSSYFHISVSSPLSQKNTAYRERTRYQHVSHNVLQKPMKYDLFYLPVAVSLKMQLNFWGTCRVVKLSWVKYTFSWWQLLIRGQPLSRSHLCQ